MDSFRPFLLCLYWDGNARLVNGNISYDEDTKMSSIVVQQRMSYTDFVNICYDTVRLSKEIYKLSLYLLYQFNGVDCTSEIFNDQTLATLFFLATNNDNYWGHVLIKSETFYQVHSPPVMQQFHSISIGKTNVGGSSFGFDVHNRDDQTVATLTAGPSTYGGHDTYTYPGPSNYMDGPSETAAVENGGATVGGFEDLVEECNSEHSEHDVDSSPVVSDDDDDSDDVDEEVVLETLPSTQTARFTTDMIPETRRTIHTTEMMQVEGSQELPEWADDEELDMWCESSGVIRCGMYFKGKDELNHAVRLWNISRGREIIISESTKYVYKARCYSTHKENALHSGEPECRWMVRASRKKNSHLWQIYKWLGEHNCYGTVVRNNNRSLKSKEIAAHVTHFIEQDVAYPVKHVQAHVKNVLHVDVSYQKAWHGRKKAIEGLHGDWESNFEELPRYIAALERSNPRTVVQWKHHDGGSSDAVVFKYVFWAFGPAINAFRLCNPVVCVDGTHLKGSYKGKMLTAVTKDANNNVLPIAYAIVDEETNESWSWFLQMFRWYVANNTNKSLCVISDRHKGIINAMNTLHEWKEPHAYHCFCLRHVRSNLMSQFKISSLKRICWVMGSTTHKRKYLLNLRQLKTISQPAWEYLKAIDTRKWTLLRDTDHRRWGNLTTNIAESMNNALKVARLLPIRACIDHTFNKTVAQFRKNIEIAMNCNTPLPPKMWRLFVIRERHANEHQITEFNHTEEIYRVVSRLMTNDSGGNDYTVEYNKKTCTCGKWQMTRFPCSHSIAVCRYRGDDIHAIVDEVYKINTYRNQYTSDFHPLPHNAYWNDPGWKIRGDSTRISNARGRIHARRMRCEMDRHYPDEPRIRRCTICKQQGHTRTRCPNSQPSYN